MEDKKLQNGQKADKEKAKNINEGVLELIEESLGNVSGGMKTISNEDNLNKHFADPEDNQFHYI